MKLKPMYMLLSILFALVLSPLVASQNTSIVKHESNSEAIRFKRKDFKIGDYSAFVLLPPEKKRSKPQPWVLYAPVLQNYPDQHENWLFNRLADAGVAVAGEI